MQYRPFAFAIGVIERTELYELLFSSTTATLFNFEGLSLEPSFIGGDRAESITKAAKTVWPTATRLLCWPHIKLGGLTKNKEKLKNQNFFDEATLDILRMHEAQSFDQFHFISFRN